ncbi:hypothetical protein N657DRAFT_692554 [Parathielavia appendiculata]|uniref:Uncharacterized protein n=1 Tax=Parathielavia appendiculata TaxID=2587402 RepID=A0AAN6Z137_9PEZI|nr:hypothetical protein N657DRAFT_692554 [Parathielavia appendiculata]
MAHEMARETAAGGAKDPTRAGPAPPPRGSQPIRLANDDEEMDGDETDDDERRRVWQWSKSHKVEKEREKNNNNWVDPAALRKIVLEAIAKVFEEKVAKAMEEACKEVQEVRREVQEKGGAPAAPAATTAQARS